MSRLRFPWRAPLLAAAAALLLAAPATPQTAKAPAKPPAPKLDPVAETALLMDGLNQANYAGLERILKQKPADGEAWKFARGQALLIAETGNLLMLRPPKNQGQDQWMESCRELREAGTSLARTTAARDYDRSVTGMADLANACNKCHQTFRVNVQVTPFAEHKE
jgi:hypothetical protein